MADTGNGLQQQQQQQKRVVVAIKAAKEISRTAVIWALTHVVQPGDCVTLLVVAPSQSSGRKLWGFPLFAGDCARLQPGTTSEQKSDITDLCSEMIHKLHDIYDPNKIIIKVKIVPGLPCGSVAAESKRVQASWVILDKQLKNEEKHCMEELQCNIVVMKHAQAKVLRLNLVGSSEVELESKLVCTLTSELDKSSEKDAKGMSDSRRPIREPSLTPTGSPEVGNLFSAGATEAGTSLSSSEPATSPGTNEGLEKEEQTPTVGIETLNVTSSISGNGTSSALVAPEFEPWMSEILSSSHISSNEVRDLSQRLNKGTHISETQMFMEKIFTLDPDAAVDTLNNSASVNIFENIREAGASTSNCRSDPDFGGNFREAGTSTLSCRLDLKIGRDASVVSNWKSRLDPEFGSVREAVSLERNAPAGSPPLCSICQHKVPVFGKPPRAFSYSELELATDGFSQANFLAEGGFGSVHRGILPDSQVIAVKQHKPASSQGDREFCSEVKVLSCAQHRNVVMLIGFCVEDNRRLLVYEYICNESLHSHLYDCTREPLAWSARQKIAVGAARGLRYLHEECRVGCIVHRDMRPNNILLTHEFHALVGDFGLARWQPDGDLAERTRVIGTIGYLAPEYSQTGEITEKTDVYSFGVVLVELISGCRAVDTRRPKGQRLLTELARPLLEEGAVNKLIDPRLGNNYSEHEVHCMSHAALLCIRHNPDSRPQMSQVLRILEGNEPCNNLKSCHDSGSRKAQVCPDQQQCSSPLQHKPSWGFCKQQSSMVQQLQGRKKGLGSSNA